MSRSLLVLFFGDLGDTLLAVPALRALREAHPHAHITLLTKALPGVIADDLGLVDEVIEVDKHLFDRPTSLLRPGVWARLLRTVWKIRRREPDTAVLLHHLVTRWGTVKYALLMLACGARVRAGIDNGRGFFLNRRVPDLGFGSRHEAEYYLDVAALVGARGTLRLEAPISEEDRRFADALLAPLAPVTGPLIAIHPGAGWYGPGRRWDPRSFAAAARIIGERCRARFLVVGTEAERQEAEVVLQELGDAALELIGKTDVGELGAVLERCALTLANDAGVGHLSAAAGTPTVTIFGPSNDAAWRPLLGTVVAAELPCRPCFYRDFERGLPNGCATRECLALVTPEMVAQAALSLLRGESVAV